MSSKAKEFMSTTLGPRVSPVIGRGSCFAVGNLREFLPGQLSVTSGKPWMWTSGGFPPSDASREGKRETSTRPLLRRFPGARRREVAPLLPRYESCAL